MNKRGLIIIGAVVYLLSPIDLLPDIFFPVGFLDDLAVLGFAATQALGGAKAEAPKQ